MNKLMLAATFAAACAFAAVSAPAFAQASDGSSTSKPATVVTKTTTAESKVAAKRAVSAADSRTCVRATGSLIPPPKNKCLPVVGNSYSQKDLQRTGAGNIGQALQTLDSSLRIGGGY